MYTQCPDCQTRFRVTAGALRAAHGTVRCGRCGSAFDALVSLTDTPPRPRWEPELAPLPLLLAAEEELAPLEEPYVERLAGHYEETLGDEALGEASDVEPGVEAATEPSADSTIVLVDEGGVGEDITLEGERVEIEGTAETGDAVAEEEYDLDATDEFEVLQIPSSAYPDEREAERELEALILRLQREFGPMPSEAQAAATDAHEETTAGHRALSELETLVPPSSTSAAEGVVVEEIEPPDATTAESAHEPEALPVAVPEGPESRQPTTVLAPPVGARPEQPPTVRATASPAQVPVEERPLSARRWQPEPVELEQVDLPERSVWKTLAWAVGSLLLVLALAAQLAHYYRQELVRDARLGPPLRAAYERLGLALPPSADLAALELRQSGEESRANGRLEVRASLTNRANFEQPYPILRLQFEDRFGSVVAKRDFEPAEYLKNPALASGTLAPGASSEAELLLVDPGVEAVGYRLDVCLRESPAMLLCAQGPG
jgi:predicted Zn finger-like uncharacterized protein